MEEEAAHTSYLGGREDVEGLPYQLSSLGHGEACAPISCPGGVEIVLVGEGVSRERTFQENSVFTSLSRMGPRDESRQDMRRSIPEESEGITCGSIMERQEENLIPALATPKFTLPPPVHRLNPHTPPTFNSAWNFQSSESQEDNSGVGAGGVSSEGQYLHDRRYEWTVGSEEAEDQSRLMSVPPSISLPVYRRALDFGKGQGPWQGGNYSEEDAQVEVEEDDGEEEEGSVYTCIECSIYFKKKAHLLEHMFQHSQEGESEGTQICEGPHTCGECGKGFVDEESLVSHGRLHQESRQKIIEEIRKLENLTDEGRSARLQCPKCLFGTNSSKVFVQHAKTHVKKGAGDSRGSIKSFQETPEIAESSVVSKQDNDRKWKSTEIEGLNEQRWRVEVPQETVNRAEQSLGKSKRKASPRQNMESLSQDELGLDAQHPRTERSPCIPQTAVQLKSQFRELLKTVEWDEEGQKRQLREEVAIVVLGKIGLTKKKPKGPLWSYRKKLRDEKGNGKTLPSKTSSVDIELPQDVWEEDDDNDDLPLDMLLMDPNYEKQLEALGLRSEERECPYCPDRFHNGIGLANHVRGHLNRVGVSYNVRHFISAEEVKAIEQNYSFQKKRKKVANFDPSTFSLMRCEFCGAGFDTRAGLSSHARAHLRDFGITNWELTVSPIHVLTRLLARSPGRPLPPFPPWHQDADADASRADPTRDIRCEFCNEFFENRKGLSSHARSHLRQMGVTEWHVNGSPIDTLRDIIRKKRPPPPQLTNIKKEPRGDRNPTSPSPTNSPISMGHSGVNRESPISPLGGRPHNNFLPPLSPKRPAPHEPRMSQSEPKSYFHLEPKSCSPSQTKTFMQGENRPKAFMHDDGRPRSYTQGDGRPKTFLQGEGKPKTFSQGENKLKPFSQGEVKPKVYTQGEGKPKTFHQGEIKPKVYSQGEGKPKAYIQTELPFKVKVKTSPEKTTTLEACCELCGLYFENRKALASHSRAHLRQFGVTEWCVNGSPIETLREWMKQRPQKAGAYLSYIQGGRPFSKKFKRSSHTPKLGAAEKESQATASGKTEADWTPGVAIEKSAEGQGQKTERRHPKPPEVPPSREDGALEHAQKTEEQRQLQRARPVPSLVPRPPPTSLVKFVGNIYTLKCRFCDIQFQGPLSIQEQWVRHLQHHILEMNYSKPPSPPVQSSPSQPEPAKAL